LLNFPQVDELNPYNKDHLQEVLMAENMPDLV